MKWKTLEHNGILFPPAFESVGIKIKIKGEKIDLDLPQEEMIYQWAKKKDTPYAQDKVFQKNFVGDFAKKLSDKFKKISYSDIDFSNAFQIVDKEKEIKERQGGEAHLSEEQVLAVVQKQAKQRREAIIQYEQAGRDDLVAKEREELEIIEAYLPKQLGDDEIRRVVQEIVTTTGASSMRDMGKVMGAAMQQLKGRADGRRINEIARELLSGHGS